jgi:membrane associated rhomboid family serine protease
VWGGGLWELTGRPASLHLSWMPGGFFFLATVTPQAIVFGAPPRQIGIMQDPDSWSGANERVETRRRREPAFNLPLFVTLSCAALIAIHAAMEFLATPQQRYEAIVWFSFIPARYGVLAGEFPVPQARFWTPLTYSLLHGGWMHLWMNVLWMVVFAAPLVQRLGAARTAAIAVLASLGGAGLHYLFYAGETVPVIGASAVVSGYMGAAARFAFQPPENRRPGAFLNVEGPALSLPQSFANRRFLTFFGVWFGINLLFGLGGIGLGGENQAIAWQAHIGGFLAGLIGFSFVDRDRDQNRDVA